MNCAAYASQSDSQKKECLTSALAAGLQEQCLSTTGNANCSANAAQQAAQTATQLMPSVPQKQVASCKGTDCNLSYVPLEPLSTAPCDFTAQDSNCKNIYTDLAGYLSYLFPLLITLGAIIGVATLVIYGVSYMTSTVTGTKQAAAERMRNALWGLLILLASVLILQTINPKLVVFDLSNLGNIGTQLQGAPQQTQTQGLLQTTGSSQTP